MKTFFTLLAFAVFCNCRAQTSVNASGGDVASATGSISYSVGQVFQETVIAGNNSIIQGVQQPFEITTLGVDNFASITVEMKVYPNPTSSILFLNFAEFAKRSSSYELFDTSGKMIRNAKIQSKESQIDLQQSPSGIYILKVSAENVVLKTFKIIKK